MTSTEARRPLYITFASRNRFAPDETVSVMIPVAADLVADLTPEEIGEAVFVATNAPFEVEGLAADVREVFTGLAKIDSFYPTLSVGDVVRVGLNGIAVRVESAGFSRV